MNAPIYIRALTEAEIWHAVQAADDTLAYLVRGVPVFDASRVMVPAPEYRQTGVEVDPDTGLDVPVIEATGWVLCNIYVPVENSAPLEGLLVESEPGEPVYVAAGS